MLLTSSATELTTSATDAVLAIECAAIVITLRGKAAVDPWRTRLWSWVFGLLGFSALLGAVAHGLALRETVRAALWKPLYLSLGILVGLFIVAAVGDWRGAAGAKRLVAGAIILGAAFFGLTQLLSGAFVIFVVYEGAALIAALAIYTFLAAGHRLKGAGVIAFAIVLNLAAAGLQASHASVQMVFPFDHNGVFHLVQMVSTAVLAVGVRLGFERNSQPPARAPGR